MTSSEDNFKHISLQDSESIIKYLEALGLGFQQGALLFSAENQQLVLKPRGLIKLEVEAKRKNDQMKLSLKMRWSEDAPVLNELSLKPISA
ncbi:MAG: amphi-Trp domain-containing protein [Desulfarculus sp.]|nr:amphi-Trp domain-containing protein [Desulfarculus sp.]MBI5524093.1 amphi-Trp domain-containing protein [Desulfarculus sp.]